ncbi:MAG: hypothetical protein LBU32_19860 [Clostridiales bacterium]|jgi:hypothetical protein|nr:hypothetical protein [Clostridiales bacterium]
MISADERKTIEFKSYCERVQDLRSFQKLLAGRSRKPRKENEFASYLCLAEVKSYLGVGIDACLNDLARNGIRYVDIKAMRKYSILSLAKMLESARMPIPEKADGADIDFNAGWEEIAGDMKSLFGSNELSLIQAASYINVSYRSLSPIFDKHAIPTRKTGIYRKVFANDFAKWLAAQERVTQRGRPFYETCKAYSPAHLQEKAVEESF